MPVYARKDLASICSSWGTKPRPLFDPGTREAIRYYKEFGAHRKVKLMEEKNDSLWPKPDFVMAPKEGHRRWRIRQMTSVASLISNLYFFGATHLDRDY